MIQLGFNTFKSPESVTVRSIGSVDESGARYIAGENHRLYGSLRKGGAVKYFSRECAGLCAGTFSSFFSYNALQSVTRPMLASQLKLTSQELLAVQRLVELPLVLSFLIGLLSDCYPIFGLRRKAYLVVGLVLNAIATISIGAVAKYIESQGEIDRNNGLITVVILLTSAASFGCIITLLCIHTRTIELSQQEPLTVRGSIQASYLILRRITSILTGVFVYAVMGDRISTTDIALSTALFLIVVISVAPLPVILRYWDEEVYSLPVPFRARSKIFWKIMQQKAVWRTMAFIAFFALCLGIKFADSANVIAGWAGAAKDNTLVLKFISDLIILLVTVVWRVFFMNRFWRTFFVWAPVFQIVPALVISALVAYDVSRDRYLYRSVISLTNVSDGIITLVNIVPLTEIVQEGSEGAMVGLVLSLQRLISIFVSTNQQGLFQGGNFFNVNEVSVDDTHVRHSVFASLVLNYAINALSVFGLLLLPTQKLVAQQMRMYGGFTKVAASGMVVFGCVLLLHSMTVNIMTFIPVTSCARIVGGPGC